MIYIITKQTCESFNWHIYNKTDLHLLNPPVTLKTTQAESAKQSTLKAQWGLFSIVSEEKLKKSMVKKSKIFF